MELLKLIHVQFHLDSYYITVLETVIQNLLSELISKRFERNVWSTALFHLQKYFWGLNILNSWFYVSHSFCIMVKFFLVDRDIWWKSFEYYMHIATSSGLSNHVLNSKKI